MRRAGYPLERNDLTYEEWLDLGRVEQVVKATEDEAKWSETLALSRLKS